MLGELSNGQIEGILSEQIIGRIGCHNSDRTYIVPISYAYDGTHLYALSFEGMKLDIMRKNPKVCFQVDTMKDMANWQSVIAWGNFEELKDKEEREKGLQILINRSLPLISSVTTHLSPMWPFVNGDLNSIKGVVFRIFLEEKTGRFENNQSAPIFVTEQF